MAAGEMAAGEGARIDHRSFAAAQSFTLGAKLHWTTKLYPALRAEHDRLETQDGLAGLAEGTLYRYYAWLERHLQRIKYSGRYGLQPYHAQDREALERAIDPAALTDHTLALDPELKPPKYYTSVDIHQHPGGLWSDPIAGHVYERGARSTTPMLGGRYRDLHQRFTDLVGGAPGRILDMGCGFGKSTKPFSESFPGAEVEAVDLSGSGPVRASQPVSSEPGSTTAVSSSLSTRFPAARSNDPVDGFASLVDA